MAATIATAVVMAELVGEIKQGLPCESHCSTLFQYYSSPVALRLLGRQEF